MVPHRTITIPKELLRNTHFLVCGVGRLVILKWWERQSEKRLGVCVRERERERESERARESAVGKDRYQLNSLQLTSPMGFKGKRQFLH